jgi:replicative superfamily II helicase
LQIDKDARELIQSGVGIHSAGLSHGDRSRISNLFLSGSIIILFCTTTLSQGINLPAHLVIVKGTQFYAQQIGYVEYQTSTILQMIGRAGRPQFDTHAIAIILTEKYRQKHFEGICSRSCIVESQILGHFTEHLNAEISSGVIRRMEDVSLWMKSTFFFCRYDSKRRNDTTLSSIEDLINTEFQKLKDAGLASMDSSGNITSTFVGQLTAKHSIDCETAVQLTQNTSVVTREDLFLLICSAHEFSSLKMRQGDKKSKRVWVLYLELLCSSSQSDLQNQKLAVPSKESEVCD